MAKRTLEQKSQKKVQNTKYMTMYDKIKSVRISKYDTAEKVKCQYRFLYNRRVKKLLLCMQPVFEGRFCKSNIILRHERP